MEITYNISREDYWQFKKYYLLRRRQMRVAAVVAFLVMALYVALVEWLLNGGLWLIVISSPLLAAGVMAVVFSRVKRSMMLVPSERGEALGEHYLAIAPEGVVGRTKLSNSLTHWGGILDIVENKGYVFIFVDAHQAHIIPKRAFRGKEDAQAFLDAARSYREKAQVSPPGLLDRYPVDG
jgi:YcxB-like protein